MNYQNQRNGMNTDRTAFRNMLKTIFESALQVKIGKERLENYQT